MLRVYQTVASVWSLLRNKPGTTGPQVISLFELHLSTKKLGKTSDELLMTCLYTKKNEILQWKIGRGFMGLLCYVHCPLNFAAGYKKALRRQSF